VGLSFRRYHHLHIKIINEMSSLILCVCVCMPVCDLVKRMCQRSALLTPTWEPAAEDTQCVSLYLLFIRGLKPKAWMQAEELMGSSEIISVLIEL